MVIYYELGSGSAMGLASDKADHYFAWSENMKEDLINFNNINANRITVTGPMIYNNYYDIPQKINSKYKKKKK